MKGCYFIVILYYDKGGMTNEAKVYYRGYAGNAW
jgi:hypothetical protein